MKGLIEMARETQAINQLVNAIADRIARMHVQTVMFKEVTDLLFQCYEEMQAYGFDEGMIGDVMSNSLIGSLDKMPAIRNQQGLEMIEDLPAEELIKAHCLMIQKVMGIVDSTGQPVGKSHQRFVC